MSAIKGQPAPKPSQVPNPIPGVEQKKDAAALLEELSADDLLGQLDGGEEQVAVAEPQERFPGANVIDQAVDYLPMVGGLAGGVIGSGAGGVGAIPGATLGAMGGQSLRRLIEINILGKDPGSFIENAPKEANDVMTAGAVEGVGQAIGAGVFKAGSKAISLADDGVRALKGAFSEAKETLEKPILEFISQRASPLTPEASGTTVKNLLKENIQGKYGPFIKAYSELDEIGAALPLKDESRRGFTMGLKEWAADNLGGDNYKIVKKITDDLDAATNGKQFRNVISQIGDARANAFQTGATQQAGVLKELQQRANDYLESETTKLASKISQGKALPEEMGFLGQLMKQRGIQEPNPMKYAKSLANDYLKSAQSIKKDYAGFKSFLEDVAEQTKVKTVSKGPLTFINDIDAVPSEKLIERMFDPKNVNALRMMQKETPEVFQQVADARIKNLVQKSSPDGNLDLNSLRKEIMKLPEDARNLLFTKDEILNLNKVLANPRLARLKSLEKAADSKMLAYLREISTLVSEKTPAAIKVPLKQAVGRGVMSVGGVKSKDDILPER